MQMTTHPQDDNMPTVVFWFSAYQMKLNTNKCQLMLNTEDHNFLKIGIFNIKISFFKKLLGITFDCKLKFSKHVKKLNAKK